MLAVRFDRFGPPDVLDIGVTPEPHPGPGQIRIRVKAAGVSPVDLALRAGASPAGRNLALPHIPGVDAAGVVDEVGPDAAAHEGDEVFGVVPLAGLGGATAEFAILDFWTRKPGRLPWTEAGGAGTGVETATRALDLLELGEGMTVLVHGAAGGVGSIVVQLAAARGARVLGAARAESHPFLESLGIRPVILGQVDEPVDRALDVAGAGSLDDLIKITGSPDNVVTLADFEGPSKGVRLSMGRLAGQPDGRHGLAVAAALAEQGLFRVPVREVFPPRNAAAAHALAARSPRWGKVVIDVVY
ncbi:NADP-dependent oxidoreductase [Herbidospora mongoliensis]|uniref:NADP-dependent oxidoreductase n=1 Tax=Herbidospora mongoliensis TaxID=688067 RepID=UPI00082AE5F0|nr:NADP-dependent oxidoreductase [Herbidospora mongoliensis]